MADIQFPINLPFGPSTFTAEVLDNNGDPRNVIDAGLDWTIRTRTDLSNDAKNLLGGRFEYAAYVESIGPGPEQQVGALQVRVNNGTTPINVDIVVPGGQLPNNTPPGPVSGAYKVVVLLTHRDNGGVVTDVAAIVDGPVLRIS